MAKTLVIVESPAKARTIERILKDGYEVLASYGHVRDLPESASEIPDEIRKGLYLELSERVREHREESGVTEEEIVADFQAARRAHR